MTKDRHVVELRERVEAVLNKIDKVLTMHDFRIVPGSTHTNLLFDVVVPFQYSISDEDLVMQIKQKVQQCVGKEYSIMVHVDKS